MSNLRDKRIIRIRISQHRADRKENLRNGQGRRPLVLQDIQTDASVRVDIWVVDLGGETDLWGLERVVCREMNRQEEDTIGVRAV